MRTIATTTATERMRLAAHALDRAGCEHEGWTCFYRRAGVGADPGTADDARLPWERTALRWIREEKARLDMRSARRRRAAMRRRLRDAQEAERCRKAWGAPERAEGPLFDGLSLADHRAYVRRLERRVAPIRPARTRGAGRPARRTAASSRTSSADPGDEPAPPAHSAHCRRACGRWGR